MKDCTFKIGDKVKVRNGLEIINCDTFESLPHGETFVVTDIQPLHPKLNQNIYGEWAIRIDGGKSGFFAIHFVSYTEKSVGFIIE